MTKDERFDKVWAKYRTFNLNGKARGKIAFYRSEKRWLKSNEGKTEDDFVEYVLLMLSEKERYNGLQRKAQQFVPNWAMAAAYFNGDSWDDEYVTTASSELREIAARFKCVMCQTTENLTRGNEEKFICLECRWQHCSGEALNLLRKGIDKAHKRLPKMKDESHYDYHLRYVKLFGKRVFTTATESQRNTSVEINPSELELDNLGARLDAEAREKFYEQETTLEKDTA